MSLEKSKTQPKKIDIIKDTEYRFENCGEGHGAPEYFVKVITYESGKIEKQVVGSKDDEVLKR